MRSDTILNRSNGFETPGMKNPTRKGKLPSLKVARKRCPMGSRQIMLNCGSLSRAIVKLEIRSWSFQRIGKHIMFCRLNIDRMLIGSFIRGDQGGLLKLDTHMYPKLIAQSHMTLHKHRFSSTTKLNKIWLGKSNYLNETANQSDRWQFHPIEIRNLVPALPWLGRISKSQVLVQTYKITFDALNEHITSLVPLNMIKSKHHNKVIINIFFWSFGISKL